MSYIQFRQQCINCKKTWNAAFGIVGMTQIASPATECPHCGCRELTKVADGWETEKPKMQTFEDYQRAIDSIMECIEAYWDGKFTDRPTRYKEKRDKAARLLLELIVLNRQTNVADHK